MDFLFSTVVSVGHTADPGTLHVFRRGAKMVYTPPSLHSLLASSVMLTYLPFVYQLIRPSWHPEPRDQPTLHYWEKSTLETVASTQDRHETRSGKWTTTAVIALKTTT